MEKCSQRFFSGVSGAVTWIIELPGYESAIDLLIIVWQCLGF